MSIRTSDCDSDSPLPVVAVEATGLSGVPSESDVQTLAQLFRVLGDPTRVRILSLLAARPSCVSDIASALELQQPAVSHQLTVLRHNRLVRYHKEGKLAIYRLDDDHVETLFSVGLEHVRE
jgi:ArsR family transcriptional regulator, lead/cadmium/zinc/bismuth-responsive transcriptional repressor